MNWFKKFLVSRDGFSGYSLYGVCKHPIDALFIRPYLGIKWFIQRGRRGFADCDAWSIDSYLNRWMPECVRRLKRKIGVPIGVLCDLYPEKARSEHFVEWTGEEMDAASKAWNEIVEQIAQGFDAAKALDDELPMPDTPRHKELLAQKDRGFVLFAKHYESLWD